MAERGRGSETKWSTGYDDWSVDGQVWSGVSGEQLREEEIRAGQRNIDRAGFMDGDGERRGAEASRRSRARVGKRQEQAGRGFSGVRVEVWR